MTKPGRTSRGRTDIGNRSKWLKRLGLVLGSTLIGLLTAELTLRMLLPTARDPYLINAQLDNERGKFCQYDSKLGWAGRPNVEDTFVGFDCKHTVRQNRHGFRGTAYPLDRTTRGRLLVLGDSFAWGYGVEEEQTFAALLERRAESSLEIVNLGVSGYGTDQELLLYREFGRKFRADQVLLVVTPSTDLMDNKFSVRYGYPKPLFELSENKGRDQLELTNVPVPRKEQWSGTQQKIDTDRHWLCRVAVRSSLVATIINATSTNQSVMAWLESRRIRIPRKVVYEWAMSSHISEMPLEWEQAHRLLTRLVQQLHAEVADDGATLTILLVPSAIDVDTALWDQFQRQNRRPYGKRWDRDQIRRRMKEFCASQGIKLIDPTDALRDAAERNNYLYYPWNQHWTPASHQIVGNLLWEQLGEPMALRSTMQQE